MYNAVTPHNTLKNLTGVFISPDVDVDTDPTGAVFNSFSELGEGIHGFHVENEKNSLGLSPLPAFHKIATVADLQTVREVRSIALKGTAAKQDFMARFTSLYSSLSASEQEQVKKNMLELNILVQKVTTHPKDSRAIGSI